MDRQCWLSGRSRAAPAPGEPAPRAAYRPQAGYGATPGALTQLLPAWPACHPGCALSWSAPTSRVHTPRTVAEQSRDGRRPAPCLSTASQSSIREKPTLERGGPPLHIHRTEDEFFYVLSGEFNFQLGDCIKRTPAGSFVFIPKDVVHTFQHVGPEPGVLLGSVHPGGFEGLFQGLPGADAETVKALFKKYNMDVVGPPLDVAMSPIRLA